MNPLASFLAGAFAMFLCSGAAGDDLDERIKKEMASQRLPGASIAVVKDGVVQLAKGYGFCNLEHKVPAVRETIYQSGSVGKQFTAAAVLLFAQDGRLKLDDPIAKHLPGVPDGWKAVTIRHLLTHTAGIRSIDYPSTFDFRKELTEDQLLKLALSKPIGSPPGAKWDYSNTGYVILGILVSKVGGKFYGYTLKERIFKPLGMKTARIISDAEIIPGRAAGYEWGGFSLKNHDWVSPTFNSTGDGSLYVTVDDFIRWDEALYEDKLLNADSKRQMWTPAKTSDGKSTGYGFGWAIDEVNGHRRLHHSGAWQGFATNFERFPDDRFMVVVLTNMAPSPGFGLPGSQPDRLAKIAAEHFLPALKAKPKKG